MAQMAPAVTAHNLDPLHAECDIFIPGHRARNRIEEGGPPAAGLEFVGGFVEGRFTGGAGVDAVGRHMFVVGAGVGSFCSLFAEDAKLLWMGNGFRNFFEAT